MTDSLTPDQVTFRRQWAMPSKATFSIPPIAAFLDRWLSGCEIVVDPFCGTNTRGSHRNDLVGGVDAEEFCASLAVIADAVLFDPPYSPRQIAEHYRAAGRLPTREDTQNGAMYSRVKRRLGALLRPGGIALSFGWNSTGFGREWPTLEVLLVQHGGAHNDTICVAQRKPA